MEKEFKLDEKQGIDHIIDLIKKGDWKATDFLFKNCWAYCRVVYYRKDWHINEEDLKSIINYSIGKAIAKYEICGKYWGLLGKIFAHEISETLRQVIEEKRKRVYGENDDFGQEDNQFSRSDIALLMGKALSMKPEEHKKCIQLELEGYSDMQIKEFLGTKKSIKDLKHHAKLNLKKVLITRFNWKIKKD